MKLILLADNDRDFLDTRAEFLESEGYRVLKALSPDEARRLMDEVHVHLAVLDLRLVDDDDEKDISGLTLAKEPAYRHVPKIMLTGFPSYQAVRETMGPALDGLPPAVDFLAKKEGPEALIEALERAFAEHVRINWDLKIRWGQQNELLPSHLVSLIAPGPPRKRLPNQAGELEDLFRKLFYEYTQLTLGRILTRREGWVLLTAFAYPPQGSKEPFVVACGQTARVQAERERYSSSVPHKAGDGATSLAQHAEMAHFGATTYRLGGCTVEEVTTLGEFYHRRSADVVLAAIKDLFHITLRLWYGEGAEEQDRPIEDFFWEWLEPDEGALTQAELEERVQSISRAALAAGIRGLSCLPHGLTFRSAEGAEASYPNPTPYLCRQERLATSPPTLCGTTHGRLDGMSVLVDRSGRTWIVDFGRTGWGPLIRDFASLETSVKFDMLKGADAAERHELERHLLAVRRLGEEIDTKGVKSEVAKALRVIGQIRSQAADVVGPRMEPYLVGLLFCAVERLLGYQPELKYLKEEITVFTHALLSMGMICQRLAAWEEPLQHLPPQATHSLWVDESNQEVWVEGRRVTLTSQRFRLLKYLYDHANQLCRRSDVAKHVFDMDYSDLHPAERKRMQKDTINSAILRLRESIEPNPRHPKYIRTVYGAGYKLVLGDTQQDGDKT